MIKKWIFLISLTMISIPNTGYGQTKPLEYNDIKDELDTLVSELGNLVDEFEMIQKHMDNMGKKHEAYDEQKNMFLSSMLAIITISTICEYQYDLLSLFMDLKDKNRRYYYDVRIESLDISLNQINNMDRQIQISYNVLSPNFFPSSLTIRERAAIQSAKDLLRKCSELLRSVKQ